jgi:hypothetical protein
MLRGSRVTEQGIGSASDALGKAPEPGSIRRADRPEQDTECNPAPPTGANLWTGGYLGRSATCTARVHSHA